jgi:hypothetical protein
MSQASRTGRFALTKEKPTMSKIATRYSVTDCSSADAVLTKCGLNWEPSLVQAAFRGPGGNSDADGFRAVVNPVSGEALAFTGTRYRPNSHVKAISDLEPLIRAGSITPHHVSVWNGGGKIAAQFRCPDLDVISPLLTLYIIHDGQGSDRSFFADFDFWCQNQAGMVAQVQGAGVRHSKSIIGRFDELVNERIRSLGQGLGERYAAMKAMGSSNKVVRGKELVSYFARVLDFAPTSVDDTFKAAHTGEVLSAEGKVLKVLVSDWRADDHGVPGSVWHAYSAVTRYTTHTEGRDEGARSLRALTGNQDRYARAFSEARALVSA